MIRGSKYFAYLHCILYIVYNTSTYYNALLATICSSPRRCDFSRDTQHISGGTAELATYGVQQECSDFYDPCYNRSGTQLRAANIIQSSW